MGICSAEYKDIRYLLKLKLKRASLSFSFPSSPPNPPAPKKREKTFFFSQSLFLLHRKRKKIMFLLPSYIDQSAVTVAFFLLFKYTHIFKTKLTTLSFIFLLYTLGNIIDAVPTQHNNTAETAASLQIVKWEKQYQQYIKATIKPRKSG